MIVVINPFISRPFRPNGYQTFRTKFFNEIWQVQNVSGMYTTY